MNIYLEDAFTRNPGNPRQWLVEAVEDLEHAVSLVADSDLGLGAVLEALRDAKRALEIFDKIKKAPITSQLPKKVECANCSASMDEVFTYIRDMPMCEDCSNSRD